MAANIEKFDFDPEKLRQKYKERREINVFVQMATISIRK